MDIAMVLSTGQRSELAHSESIPVVTTRILPAKRKIIER